MADPTVIESFIKDTDELAHSIKVYLDGSDGIVEALNQDGLDEDASAAISLKPNEINDDTLKYVSDKIGDMSLTELRAAADEDAAAPFLPYYRDKIVAEERTAGNDALEALDGIACTLRNESDLPRITEIIKDYWRTVDDLFARTFDLGSTHQQTKIGAFATLALKAYASSETLNFDNVFGRVRSQRHFLANDMLPIWRRASLIGRDPGATLLPPTAYGTSYSPKTYTADDCCNRIVDAISRLQEGGSGGLASSGATGLSARGGDFGKTLDQQIYTTLGLPSLISDTAMSTDPAKLVDKLIAGLDRAVLRVERGEATEYVFSPAQARAVAPLDGGYAVGAQGVVAEAIAAHKPTILRYMNLLEPESCHCSEEEVDDIKEDIERSLDLLVAETRTSVGVFSEWAVTLIHRLKLDVTALIDLYGIKCESTTDAYDYVCKFVQDHIGVATGISPADEGRTIDRDVGFLTREANDQAIQGIFTELKLITLHIEGLATFKRGPILVRLRAVIEALPPSVMNARSALNLAGVGEVDRSAAFVAAPPLRDVSDLGITGNNVIDLARLLSWIEACANEWRSRLLEDDLNNRDLSWLEQTLNVQAHALTSALCNFNGTDSDCVFATINENDFALGFRQLREVEKHLDFALELVRGLRQSITDRVAPNDELGREAHA